MARSYVLYSGNAVQENFSIPFGYLDRDHVVVSVNNVVKEEETDYTFQSASVIHFLTAPGSGSSNVNIARNTPTNTAVVDFEDGSTLLEGDLDNAALQALYATEEALDALDAEEAAREAAINTVNTALNTINTAYEAADDAINTAYQAADSAINTAYQAADAALNTAIQAVADDLAAAQIEAGNVPTPQDPDDNGKSLIANNGTYDWGDPTLPTIDADDISDATTVGKALIRAASEAAGRTAINAAAATHTHDSDDISDATATGKAVITAADAAAARTATGAAKQLAPVALTPDTTVAIDASLSDTFTLLADQNFVLGNPTNGTDGQRIIIRIKQDGTGGRTLTFDSDWRLGTDITAVVLSTDANKVDYIGAYYNSTDDKWDVLAFVKGY